MLMRVALVYVMAVISAVLAFALYWQEGRLATMQESFLKASNELAAKSSELDGLRQRKTVSEERAFQAEAGLREARSQQEVIDAEMAQSRKIKEETEAALAKAQVTVRDVTAAKTAAVDRAAELEAKLNRATVELEALRGSKPAAAAKPSPPVAPAAAPSAAPAASSTGPAASAPAAVSAGTMKQKVQIEPDPTVRQQGSPASDVTTQSITPLADDTKSAAAEKPDLSAGNRAGAKKPAEAKSAKPKTVAKRKPKASDEPVPFFPF